MGWLKQAIHLKHNKGVKNRQDGYQRESAGQNLCTIAESSDSFKHHENKWCGEFNSQSEQPANIVGINPVICNREHLVASPAHYGTQRIYDKSRVAGCAPIDKPSLERVDEKKVLSTR